MAETWILWKLIRCFLKSSGRVNSDEQIVQQYSFFLSWYRICCLRFVNLSLSQSEFLTRNTRTEPRRLIRTVPGSQAVTLNGHKRYKISFLSQIIFSGKTFVTCVTFEWLLPSVSKLMPNNIRVCTKLFFTNWTLSVGLFVLTTDLHFLPTFYPYKLSVGSKLYCITYAKIYKSVPKLDGPYV